MDRPNRSVRNSAAESYPKLFQRAARNRPTKSDEVPMAIRIDIATAPSLYAIPPHTTKVPAEKVVMKAERPESHQGDCPPALNMSFVELIRENKLPMMTSPIK